MLYNLLCEVMSITNEGSSHRGHIMIICSIRPLVAPPVGALRQNALSVYTDTVSDIRAGVCLTESCESS